ncbi:MAG: methyltransferase domain-containing protein [Arenicellales bacterium]
MKRTALLCHKCAVNKRFRHPNTLPAWLQTALGRSLMEAEHECLRHMLAGLFGPVAVQISETGFYSFVRFSHAAFCYTASMDPARRRDDGSISLYCIPEQLPFETKSVGLVILPHVLEFSDYPHQILREVERILVPEGSVVVLGFNPLSIWGAVSLFRRGHAPWNGRFSTLGRIKDWLTLLNFELTAGRMVYHKPPVQSERVRQRLKFLERAGDRWWPLGAAVYAVVARKREIGVTPLYPRWKRERRLSPGLAKPVARSRCASYDRFR